MDYEKKYKETLERAKQIHRFSSDIAEIKRMEELFPELKESEDEKIRKNLITFFKDDYGTNSNTLFAGIKVKDIIAWLEKQCEQKHVDKVEPKFHDGDWVVCETTGSVYQIKKCIENLINHKYGYDLTNGDYIGSDDVNHYHLWTIEDAKDGDVLFHSDSASNGIFIFKEIAQCGNIQKVVCYCDYDSEDGFCLGEKHTCCWTNSKILHPATKEQRGILFARMKEKGYEWKDKELIKVPKPKEATGALKQLLDEEKSWSEEDERLKNTTISFLKDFADKGYENAVECIDWVKQFKYRIGC